MEKNKYPLEHEQEKIYHMILTSLERKEYDFCIRAIALFNWIEDQKIKLPGSSNFGVSTVTTIERGLEAEGFYASKIDLSESYYLSQSK